MLPPDQRAVIKQSKFAYSLLGKAFEKQIKALEEDGKKLVKSSSEKKSSTHLKQQKKIFEELANKRIDEIQNSSKQIDFNNLTYYFKGKSAWLIFIGFKGPLGFNKNIREGYIAIEKAEGK